MRSFSPASVLLALLAFPGCGASADDGPAGLASADASGGGGSAQSGASASAGSAGKGLGGAGAAGKGGPAGASGAGTGGVAGAASGAAGAGGAGAAGGSGAAGTSAGAAGLSGSSGAAGLGGAAGAGGAKSGPLGTTILDGGTPRPLYRVTDPKGPRAIAYRQAGNTLQALDDAGAVVWTKDAGPGALFGGFDFDADGLVDAGLVRSETLATLCGTTPMQRTSLDVVSGKTGQIVSLTSPLDDKCWMFPTATYPTQQWTGSILFGAPVSTLAVAPYYATDGEYRAYQADTQAFAQTGSYVYPSTSSFDVTYAASQPNAYGNGQKHIENAHVGNGLIADVGGPRLVFFTSGRVVEYLLTPLTSLQLLRDTPFLTGGRKDVAGRNYGLVAIDPGATGGLALVAGTSAGTVLSDMLSGKMEADPWGQIERHVTRYQMSTGALDDRFFSYAHDANDGHKYEGRVVYAAGPWVRAKPGPSRLAFNVYEGGRWYVHVTEPGTTKDALTMKDWFLWDVRDVDGDGNDEWVMSPSHDPTDPDVPGFYFLKWRTVVGHWDEATTSVSLGTPHEGVIPRLVSRFREPSTTTSMGALEEVATVVVGGALHLLVVAPGGAVSTLPVSGL